MWSGPWRVLSYLLVLSALVGSHGYKLRVCSLRENFSLSLIIPMNEALNSPQIEEKNKEDETRKSFRDISKSKYSPILSLA